MEYTGSVYIGVVGPETEFGVCRDSIEQILIRPGDSRPFYVRATKGFEARQEHFNRWLTQTNFPFMLLLDHDMVFAPDTLERLRLHKKSLVSGYYLRRRFAPIYSVWFKFEKENDTFPRHPWTKIPERNEGKIYPLSGSGFGCVLVHRQVADDMKAVLKGEQIVLEDDMDVWPYDLMQVMAAVKGIQTLVDEKMEARTLRTALAGYAAILTREVRVLRGNNEVIGSDLRFPFYAREAGHIMYGDPNVRPEHLLFYHLTPDDFDAQPEAGRQEFERTTNKYVKQHRERIATGLRKLDKAGE